LQCRNGRVEQPDRLPFMHTPPKQPKRLFIGWDKPLGESVAATVLQSTPPTDGILDLGNHLIIAPSAFAGRLIQEAFAKQAAALLLPKITTPHHFLTQQAEASDAPEAELDEQLAGAEAMLLAWVDVLTNQVNRADPTFGALFTAKQAGGFAPEGAIAFAQDLMRLRDELNASAAGLSFTDVAQVIAGSPKADGMGNQVKRWEALGILEHRYLAQLKRNGFQDHNLHRLITAKSDRLPKGIDTIWLACVIDPQPLLETALQNRLAKAQVKVLIAADAAKDADHFNEWGRPKEEAWSRGIGSPWKDFATCVHVVRKPEDGLDVLNQLVETYHRSTGGQTEYDTRGRLAVVPCDREKHPDLIAKSLHAIARNPKGEPLIVTANPLGKKHGKHGLHHAMAALLDFVEDPSFANLRRSTIHPQVAHHLGLSQIEVGTADAKRKLGWFGMQRLLDAVSSATPPQNLAEASAFALKQPVDESVESHEKRKNQAIKDCAPLLDLAQKQANDLRALSWFNLGLKLLEIARPFGDENSKPSEAKYLEDVDDAIVETLGGLECFRPEATGLAPTDIVRLVLSTTANLSFRGDMDRDAVNLPGWMETPWEPVPHLVIFGMTDDLIPGTKHAHPFLPGSLRGLLGLSTSQRQFANAAYTLELVRRLRANNGRVDIIIPRLNGQGDGLRPSRLLMLSPETDGDHLLAKGKLRGRLDHLLDEPKVPRTEPIWGVSEALRLDPTLTLKDDEHAQKKLQRLHCSISATGFKTFLEDPSQYWMKNALGMSESKHGEMELDAADFGTMAHAAVEKFGKDEASRDTPDAEKIAEILEQHLNEHFAERFGSEPSSTLLLQKEIALARLRRFAEAQAQLFADGWRIIDTEGKLPSGKTPEEGIIPGFELRGRFDRLDRNIYPDQKTGKIRYRVYDYKTFAKATNPQSRHLFVKGPFNKGIELADFTIPGVPKAQGQKAKDPKQQRWKDLQLPAYHWALTTHHDQVKLGTLEIAYLCLSADTDEDPVRVWDNFEEVREYSLVCMKAVCRLLMSREAAAFAPAKKPSPYPILAGLSGRPTNAYMDTSKLGVTRLD
jgi:ATP-dependent helicase/nuclease subunit B